MAPRDTRLHVANLSADVDVDDLRALFEGDGRRVVGLRIITARESGSERGYGIVRMATARDAVAAIEALNGAVLDGQSLAVTQVEEKASAS